ncbi:hypothetical protein [Leptospira brenneri]|uniref:Alpha/beta hydrolase n=1 Tax=Leptospira brenneri TaxID=2023182 RepID=A0A2M9XX28_9LEPT|nr:hypothetical protein [Leptospira brenneri]PJZ43839.1 hypothetical protein CH361_18350 [Leptospira brenneri]TGK92415.1 hypothetical protein EHQ30_13240 [Leptospira brenneri]
MSLIRLLQKEIPSTVLDETDLFLKAKSILPNITFQDIGADQLIEIQKSHGIDLATAFLYDLILNRSGVPSFYKQLYSFSPESGKFGKIKGKVLAVPAGLYEELPEYAGDGSLVLSIAKKFGLETLKIPVQSKGKINDNVKIIYETIAKEKEPLYVFSFSKGGSDFRMFLEKYPELSPRIKLWVSVGGIHKGLHLVERFVGNSKLKNFFSKSLLNVVGIPLEFVSDFSLQPNDLNKPFSLPKNLKTVSVVGFPIESHLKGTIRSRYKYLSSFGPNDGVTLLLDAIIPDSHIIPVWGTDHYFRSPKISNVFHQIFHAIYKGWI